MVEGYGTVDPKAYVTPPPMTSLSYRSQLIELVSSGKHHDVKVDEISRLRLIAWVDAMCPYMGDDEVREIPDPVFQGVDWLAVRPKIKTAPRIIRPGPCGLISGRRGRPARLVNWRAGALCAPATSPNSGFSATQKTRPNPHSEPFLAQLPKDYCPSIS